MSKRKKKKKETSVTFELVIGRDENGNLVQHFVPKKVLSSKRNSRSQDSVQRILSKFSVDDEEESPQNDGDGMNEDVKAMMTDYDSVKKNLTKEDRRKYSVDGMFPDDGFDYSKFVIDESQIYKDNDDVDQLPKKNPEQRVEEVETFEEEAYGEDEDFYDEEYGEYYEEEDLEGEGEKEKETKVKEEDLFEDAETIVEEDPGDEDEDPSEKYDDGSIFDLFFGGEGPNSNQEGEGSEPKVKGKGKTKKKKFLFEKPLQSKALTDEQKQLNLAFKESLSKLDNDLFGDEFDDEFGDENENERLQLELELEAEGEEEEEEMEMGGEGMSFEDIEHVLDDFIKVQEQNSVTGYMDADHQTDGIVSHEDQEKYSKYAPDGMFLLTESMRKKLRRGDVDRNEMVKIMLDWMKRSRKGKHKEGKEEEEIAEDERYGGILKKKEKDKYDAESIISTYSNIENRPTMISNERKRRRKQEDFGEEEISVEEKIFELNEVAKSGLDTSKKAKGKETRAEKRRRKKEVKKLRMQKRKLKKELKGKYKREIIKRRNLEAGDLKNKKVALN